MRIALATAPRFAYPDEEAPIIADELRKRGVDARCEAWYDPEVNWSSFDTVVIKSAWDIYSADTRIKQFLSWLDIRDQQSSVINSASVIRWTLDKRYLVQLQTRGIPTVPTIVVEVGESGEFPAGGFVVKPVTSAGSRMSARYDKNEHGKAADHVRILHEQGSAAIVQPYVTSLDSVGERALVFFAGTFSHAVKKRAVLKRGEAYDAEKDAHPSPEVYQPTAGELQLAEQTFHVIPPGGRLSHARVDIVTLEDGTPAVMELEFVDPWLFFEFEHVAAPRMAEAVLSFAK